MEGSALRPKLNPSKPRGFYHHQKLLEHFNSGEVGPRGTQIEGGLDISVHFFLPLDVQYEMKGM